MQLRSEITAFLNAMTTNTGSDDSTLVTLKGSFQKGGCGVGLNNEGGATREWWR